MAVKPGEAARGLFLSYRRSDSGPWAGRLCDDLRTYYGRDRVFFDLDSQVSAQDYEVQLASALQRCKALMVVLGPQWLADLRSREGVADQKAADWVRRELSTALTAGLVVVPVLVGGAAMPTSQDLPDDVRAFAVLQARSMRDTDWDYDLGRLLDTLEGYGLYANLVEPDSQRAEWTPTSPRRYQRQVQATRKRTLDSVVSAVEGLRYKDRKIYSEAAQVSFRATGRTITVKVVDGDPGHSVVVVQYPALKVGVTAFGTTVLALATSGLGLAAWPAMRLLERRFAVGFLDNVESVLQGRGVGEDSAVPPGVSNWRNRSRDA